jgi:tetratricopeptide (TPR) repeat protein
METFYDTLDIRPDDDVEKVKDAFRKAVKASHPDLNGGDPDAAARFMQIVRAKEILGDPELRAIYDRMLEFERQQLCPTSGPSTVLDATLSIVPDAIVIVILAIILAGAFTLFTYRPGTFPAKVEVVDDGTHGPATVASIAAVPPPPSADATAGDDPATVASIAAVPPPPSADATAGAGPATVAPPPSADATAGGGPRGKVGVAEAPLPSVVAIEGAAPEPNNVVSAQLPSSTDASAGHKSDGDAKASVPNAVAPTTSSAVAVENGAPALIVEPSATTNEALLSDRLTSSLPVKDAGFYRGQGIAAYRQGDVSLAIADFNLAIRLDPNFKNAYVDRGLAFYRMGEFNRAFADIAQAIRLENSDRITTPPLPKASPLSVSRDRTRAGPSH